MVAVSTAVSAVSEQLAEQALSLANKLSIPLLPPAVDPAVVTDFPLLLRLSHSGLQLQQTGFKAPGPVWVDFGSARMRHRRRSAANEAVGRAVGVRKGKLPRVLDATAGLGRDAFVLADMGCSLALCEREIVLAELLHFGLQAARSSEDQWLRAVAERIELWPGDCLTVPSSKLADVDVIYLDPMFPQRDKSALVKKEMAVLKLLLGDPNDQEPAALLRWARSQPVSRVVVKRPSKAPPVAGTTPSHAITGKAVRYDVYQMGI